jgi:hypothetical protein
MDWAEAAGSPSHWDEAWLWTELEPPPMWVSSNIFPGYATFTGSSSMGWALVRVWLRPTSRRCGLLSAVWPQWQDRYRDFEVVRPSDAMRAFLARVGYEPGPSLAGERPLSWLPLASR